MRLNSSLSFLCNILCVLVLALLLALPAAANSASANKLRLQQLQREIGVLSHELERRRGVRSSAQQQLAIVERDLSEKSGRLRTVRANLAATSVRLRKLEGKHRTEENELNRQRDALRSSLQSAWMAGRNQELKLLLNQQSSAELGRMLTYYRYLAEARSTRIATYKRQLGNYNEVKLQLVETQLMLKGQLSGAERLVAELDADRDSREVAIAEIDRELRRQGRQLGELQIEESEIAGLLAKLERAVKRVPPRRFVEPRGNPDQSNEVASAAPKGVEIAANSGNQVQPAAYVPYRGPKKAFRGLRGQLPWPSDGMLRKSRFSRLKGVLIAADRGAPVRAVAHGEVVFADWLQHFGMLVIVDHGKGYMSLYGHNEVLLVNVGQLVEAGDLLARVGDTGGRQQAALYFELRHNRANLSPQRWLARRG